MLVGGASTPFSSLIGVLLHSVVLLCISYPDKVRAMREIFT